MPITYCAAYANYADTRCDLINWLEEPGGVEHLTVYGQSKRVTVQKGQRHLVF